MRKFTRQDQQIVAEYICDEYSTRKRERSTKEKQWKEIDRQIAMVPDDSHKKIPQTDSTDEYKAWMSETELPWQAQTLEITTADARRMKFPDSGPWFAPHVALTDDYLSRVDLESLVTGDENGVPSKITQDNADKLVHGILEHWHRQYDFYSAMDYIDAEAIKYGIGIGRAKIVQKSIFLHTAKGVHKADDLIPALIPRSIKNTYLDMKDFALMNEGYAITGSVIYSDIRLLKDIEIAASKGSNNPELPNGGWMPKNISKLKPDDKGQVAILEYEGDMVVPRKTTESLHLPNVVITVAVGEGSREIIRIRYNKYSFSSYIGFPYHVESIDSPYGTSPCMKGYPLQKAAVQALNRTFDAAALQNDPPLGYDKDDQEFAQSGGPRIYPGAQWPTLGELKPYEFGNPTAFYQIFAGLRQEYSNVTGTDAPRLGAQTISHTTAYAKEAELSRGTVRTVDFVRNTLKGPLARWLDIEYKIGLDVMKKTDIYIPAYNGFVTIEKKHLPEKVVFDVHGSGGPGEEQTKNQVRMAALQMAMQVDNLNKQMGGQPKLDLDKVIEQILQQGGWNDIDALTIAEEPTPGVIGPGGVEGAAEPNPGAETAALQAIAFGQGRTS